MCISYVAENAQNVIVITVTEEMMKQVEQRGQRAHTQLHAHMEDGRDIPFIIKMSLPRGKKKTNL